MKKLDVVCSLLVSISCIYLYYQDNPVSIYMLAISNLAYALLAYLLQVRLNDFKKLTNFK